MKSYFKAIHSSGTVHLRASQSGRPYAWAEVGARFNCVSFASKRPGKLSKYAPADAEIVPVQEITVTEYNQLLKASKHSCSTVFLGKKYTHTDNIQQPRAVCAIGAHYPKHEHRVELKPLDPSDEQSIRQWERYPAGFWINSYSEQTNVWFYSDKERALSDLKRYQDKTVNWQHLPDVYELLEVTQD